MRGHDHVITSLSFSADGSRLVSASKDRTVKIWDAATGRALQTLRWHIGAVIAATYRPDGKSLVSISANDTRNELKIWDAQGDAVSPFAKDSDRFSCVAYSPNGDRIAAGTSLQTIRVWDAGTLQPSHEFAFEASSVASDVKFSPDGKTIAAASVNTVWAWDLETGKRIFNHAEPGTPGSRKLTFGRGGTVLSIPAYHEVKVVELKTGKILFRTTSPKTAFASTAGFSADGKQLITVTKDGIIKIWEIDTGREVSALAGWGREPTAIALSPDGTQLALARYSPAEIKLVDLSGPMKPTTLPSSTGHHTLAFSPDGKHLAVPAPQNQIDVWEVAGLRKAFSLTCPNGYAMDVAFSPNGRWLAASTSSGGTVWDLDTRELAFTVPRKAWLARVAFNGDSRLLATAGIHRSLQLWDVPSWKEVRSLVGSNPHPNTAAFSPDGRWLASAAGQAQGSSGEIMIWDLATGKQSTAYLGHADRVYTVAYSPDGRQLASASQDSTVKVWDVANGDTVWTLTGHGSEVNCVAFSPDGRRLASAGNDRTVRLWDLSCGQELLTLSGHARQVYGVAFSPDGQYLASTGADGTVQIWHGPRPSDKK
jgi:WD40 repeat protein